jgi:hydroxymethylglutaryl-CoA synthase
MLNTTPPAEFGIIAMEMYIPKIYIDQSDFEIAKKISPGKITQGLGQEWMSFVSELEDVNSMALTALKMLLERFSLSPEQIGKLEFATETLHDKSKSSKTILMQLLSSNKDIEGVTNINACYGGTAAIFNSLNWLKTESNGKLAIVVMSDVAVYDTIAAQPTGGAGAIAILLGPKPAIVIDPLRSSYFDDEYDFYKPRMEKEYPTVNGQLSTKLYINVLLQTFQKLREKYRLLGGQLNLNTFDYFCFHCPFSKQVEKAFLKLYYNEMGNGHYTPRDRTGLQKLLAEKPQFDDPTTQRFLRNLLKEEIISQLLPTLIMNRKIGNIYTGSLYLSLMSLIFHRNDSDLQGRRAFMYSYGSGVSASSFSIKFNSAFTKSNFLNVPRVNDMFLNRTKIDISTFDALNLRREKQYNGFGFQNFPRSEHLRVDTYYLSSVDKTGYRKYVLFAHGNERIHSIAQSVTSNKLEPSKFRKMEISERMLFIKQETGIDLASDYTDESLDFKTANLMVENCIGTIKLPVGVALNFVINGKKYIVPMVTEEPSVIAGSCNSAKLISSTSEGFSASATKNIVRGQIFLENIRAERDIDKILLEAKNEIITYSNENLCVSIVQKGGGVIDVQLSRFSPQKAVIYVLVDVQSSMGANTINTILEGLKPKMKSLFHADVLMTIVSNLCPERIAKASFEIPVKSLSTADNNGVEMARRIISANQMAIEDIFRACTHNKGIMNGVEAVAIAVGQDIRAIEASCHTFSIYKYGKYRALTNYYLTKDGQYLRGELEMPYLVGTVGGATNSNKLYRANLKLLGEPNSSELGCILASVGLAQNFAALKALTSEGIQKGHMRLHAHNLAISAGVDLARVQQAVDYMIEKNSITMETAAEFLKLR